MTRNTPIKKYRFGKYLYQIYKCTTDDIDLHLSIMCKIWSNSTDIDTQRKMMLDAVYANTANYMTTNNNLSQFIYFYRKDGNAIGIAYWVRSYRELYLGMGYYLYNRNISRIYFEPHVDITEPFKKLVTRSITDRTGNALKIIDFEYPTLQYHIKRIYNNATTM